MTKIRLVYSDGDFRSASTAFLYAAAHKEEVDGESFHPKIFLAIWVDKAYETRERFNTTAIHSWERIPEKDQDVKCAVNILFPGKECAVYRSTTGTTSVYLMEANKDGHKEYEVVILGNTELAKQRYRAIPDHLSGNHYFESDF